jgi:hypothetical protein
MTNDRTCGEVIVTPIFRWNGLYVGFLSDQWFFGADGRYLGWYGEDLQVWRSDGVALGKIVDRHYILRDRRVAPPVRRTPPVPPVPPTLPRPPANRIARVPLPGWVDALEEIGRRPTRDELLGEWWLDENVLSVSADGRFVWSEHGDVKTTGSWSYRENLITTPDPPGNADNIVYRVIEFTGDTLTLRRVTFDENSLLFTLRRHIGVPAAGAYQRQGPRA